MYNKETAISIGPWYILVPDIYQDGLMYDSHFYNKVDQPIFDYWISAHKRVFFKAASNSKSIPIEGYAIYKLVWE